MSLQLTAQPPYHIVKWNFLTELAKETETPEYRTSAFVFLSNIQEKDGRWDFTITIKVNRLQYNSDLWPIVGCIREVWVELIVQFSRIHYQNISPLRYEIISLRV